MKPLSDATRKVFAPLRIDANDRALLKLNDDQSCFVVDFWNQKEGDRYKYVPSKGTQELIKRFPESKRLTGTAHSVYAWQFAATDYTVELFATLFPKEQMEFVDEQAQQLYDIILMCSVFAEQCAEVSANYKLRKERFDEKRAADEIYLLPDALEGLEYESREWNHNLAQISVPENTYEYSAELPLNPYQQIALYNTLQSEGFGLFMEQGTGKTAPTIAAICNAAAYLRQQQIGGVKRMYNGIIVCPKNVRMNWEKEFQKFATQAGKITVLRGTEVGRIKQIIDAMTPDADSIYSLIVCSYETLTRSWDALAMIPWDIAVLDELHSIKSVKTKRFDTAIKLRDKSAQRMGLTGTPITNSIMDLYAELEFLGKGYSGFSSFDAFRKFYGVYETNDSGQTSLVGVQNLPFIQERLARYTYITTKAEALPDLPDKVYDVYEVEMTSQQEEFYKDLATKLSLEIENELDSSQNKSMVINNVLTKLLRLAHITSGFVTWSAEVSDIGDIIREKEVNYFVPNPKVEALLEILRDKGPDEKTIVWACWTPDIYYIQQALEQNGIDYVSFVGKTTDAQRKEAEDRFNGDVNCRLFLGNAAAGGTGLNLLGYPPEKPDEYTTNCNHVIYFSQNWSPTSRSQSEDRAHRKGTRVQVRYTDLVVPMTIDEEIRSRVVDKRINAMEISDLREILRNVFRK